MKQFEQHLDKNEYIWVNVPKFLSVSLQFIEHATCKYKYWEDRSRNQNGQVKGLG